jgi:hypothetical protein
MAGVPPPGVDPFQRLPWRRRLLIALLAVATAVTVILMLLDPPGGVVRSRAAVSEPPACAPGTGPASANGAAQTGGPDSRCLGAMTRVLPPAAPVAPAR